MSDKRGLRRATVFSFCALGILGVIFGEKEVSERDHYLNLGLPYAQDIFTEKALKAAYSSKIHFIQIFLLHNDRS